MKKIRHTIEFLALKAILLPLRLLPFRVSVALGGFFGNVLWFFGIRKSVSRFNMSLCFPEIGGRQTDRIIRESYKNFCRSMVEFALLPRIKDRTVDYVLFDGKEELSQLVENNTGALLVTGHFGSWELLGAGLVEAGIPLDFLVGEQTNSSTDEFINGIRAAMGIGIIHMGVAARGIIKSVKGGRMVAMLSDQDAGKSSVIVDFFGNPAATPQGIAAFALKLKCPIIFGGIFRIDGTARHKVEIQIILPDYKNLASDKEEAIREVTQLYTSRLEDIIRKAPEMYFWPHRRFKRTIEYK